MKLIVGLGNPGERYAGSRHNLGFAVVDKLLTEWLTVKQPEKFWQFNKDFNSEIGKIQEKDVLLVKPQTHMNSSGIAVKKIADYFKVAPEDVIIVHDDLDLILGKIKVRLGGGLGGHHGLESIMNHLGTDKFIRVRLGIGNQKSHSGEHKRISFSAEKFVLEEFEQNEHSEVRRMIKQAIQALKTLLDKGLETAQNQFN